MKKARKALAFLLALTSLTGLVGCGSNDESKTSESTTSKTAEVTSATDKTQSEFQTTFGSKTFDKAEVSVMVFDRSNAPEGSTVVDNKWVDYINESMGKVGITVKFVAVPRAEEVNKVQLMMSSGTAADIMLCYTNSIVEGFFNDGGTIDLAPYIDGDDQAKNLKEYVGEDCLAIGRNKDDAQWSIPARRSTTASSNMFIRKDWLDALNMEVPTTVDELYTVLQAFKEKNPDGKKDVKASAFGACTKAGDPAGLMSRAFLKSVADEKTFAIDNGSAADLIYTDEGFGEYFKWMNKIYNNGLMDPEYYANITNDNLMKEDFVNGKLGVFESNVNYNVDSLRGSLLKTLQETNPKADIISIPPMKNVNDGKVYNNGYPINGAFVFIPQTCKNVEASLTYLDWLATKEGGFTVFHGLEGINFKYDENKVPCVIDSAFNATDKDWTRHDLFLIGNQGYYKTPAEFAKATSKEAPGYEDYVIKNYENAAAGIVRNDPTFTAPTFTAKNTEISVIREEYFVKLVTCAVDKYDATLAEFKSKLKDVGYDTIIKERTDYYNKVFGK